jgi:hypothetical protein
MTSPESEQRLASLFDRLRTSSDAGPAQDTNRPLLLVNILRVRAVVAECGWRVFSEDLVGLAAGFGLVAALVTATAWLLAG